MASHLLHEINELNFDTEVLGAELPFLLEFGARWCPPCRALEPIVAAVAQELRGKLQAGKVDGETSPALSTRLQVRGFPTLIVFVGGKERARAVGMMSRKRVLELVGVEDAHAVCRLT